MQDNPIQNGFVVYQLIMAHIEQRTPLSMIRLGDGEGAFLGYPDFVEPRRVEHVEKIWFGEPLQDEQARNTITQNMRKAVRNADIVGLPRQKQLAIHPMYEAVIKTITKLNLLTAQQYITDAAIHRYLQFALLYRPLLQNRNFVGVISSRNLNDELQNLFGIKQIKLYQIRGESRYPGEVERPHFPEHFNWLLENIEVPFEGALFLVGAGGLGKIYCDTIKRKGGIALDVGAIFDAWAGVKSRLIHPCHSLQRYREQPVITAQEAVTNYNRLVEEFSIDTPPIEMAALSSMPPGW